MDILDKDGKNQAVRAFLQMYGIPGLTAKQMHNHMCASGFKGTSPDWVDKAPGFLTKGGAQAWLRKLFALESDTKYADLLGEVAQYRVLVQYNTLEIENLENHIRDLEAALKIVDTEVNYG